MSNHSTSVQGDVSKEKLMQDLQLVVSDAENLLKATAGQAGEKVSAARERIEESVAAAKERLAVAQDAMLEKTKQAARATDDYVHENPWRAVGIGAAVGLVVGMLISRGR
ncbi:MAG: DUF883 family protein [Gallionella sp.]|jgi:ElaB/YqjD/DUF883 family membrane-anchored ribosome-binding protein